MSNFYPVVGKQQHERHIACIERNILHFDDYTSKELIETKIATPPASIESQKI